MSGMTTMIRLDSQILPIGSVSRDTSLWVPGPAPVTRLVVTPTAAPQTRPSRIFVWSFMR